MRANIIDDNKKVKREKINLIDFMRLYKVGSIPIIDFIFVYFILYATNRIFMLTDHRIIIILTIPITLLIDLMSNPEVRLNGLIAILFALSLCYAYNLFISL